MSLLAVNRDPTPRQLRLFGAVALALTGVLAWRLHAHGHPHLGLLLAVGVPVLVGPGLFALRWLRLVYLGACYLTFPIGYVVSHVLLAAMYYLVLLPIGLLLRCCGHDPLERKWDPDASSYWQERTPPAKPDRYFDQH